MPYLKIKTLFITLLVCNCFLQNTAWGGVITIINECDRDEIHVYPPFGLQGWPECLPPNDGVLNILPGTLSQGTTNPIQVQDAFREGQPCLYTVQTREAGDNIGADNVPSNAKVKCTLGDMSYSGKKKCVCFQIPI